MEPAKIIQINKNTKLREFNNFLLNLSKETYYNFNTFGTLKKSNSSIKIAKIELKRTDKIKFFTTIDNKLISYSFLSKFTKPSKKHNCVLGIVIADDWQNRGFGKKILKFMIKTAWNQNYEKIWLTVFSDNYKAIRLYASLGFQIEGIFLDDEIIGGKKRHVVSMAIFKKNLKISKKRSIIIKNLKSL